MKNNTPWYLQLSNKDPWYARVAAEINAADQPTKWSSAIPLPIIPTWEQITDNYAKSASQTANVPAPPVTTPIVPTKTPAKSNFPSRQHPFRPILQKGINGRSNMIPEVNTAPNTAKQYAKASFDNQGMSPEKVKQLQQQLVDAGYGKILGRVDGMWGAKSAAALAAFQQDQKNLENRYEDMGSYKNPHLQTNVNTKQLLPMKKQGGNLEVINNIISSFKKGGSIHINPANKGKFTATKKETGKSTEELTHSKNPLTRKRAVFAQNAKKWKHQDGGELKKPNTIATKDSTQYYSNQMKNNIAEHFAAKYPQDKALAAKKVTQSKDNLERQGNKGKPGFDKNGFPLKKQFGGSMPDKGGDQAAVYKKGTKMNKKGIMPAKNQKIDASKWKKKK